MTVFPVVLNSLFSNQIYLGMCWKCSFIFHFSCHAMIMQIDSLIDASYSFPLRFEKLAEVNEEGSQWTDCEIKNAINLVYQNLNKLESYISFLVRAYVVSLCSLILEKLNLCIN